VNAEFNWWLLIVGLVIGAGLVWLILADSSRREADIFDEEVPVEAEWIATRLRSAGIPVDQATAEEVLRLHRAWLASPPPEPARATVSEPESISELTAPAPAAAPGVARATEKEPVIRRDAEPS